MFLLAFLTAESELLTVGSVESVKWTLFKAFTGRRLYCLPSVVARLTEVMGSETEPSGCFTTVSALK